jgi:hypothetical protein
VSVLRGRGAGVVGQNAQARAQGEARGKIAGGRALAQAENAVLLVGVVQD